MVQNPRFFNKNSKNTPESGAAGKMEDKSLMFKKSTNDLIGWVVGVFGVIPLTNRCTLLWFQSGRLPADTNNHT
jgi:hypothetical protein